MKGRFFCAAAIWILAVIVCVLMSAPIRADNIIYQEDFNEALNWKAIAPAEVSPFGRSGKALKISTYLKDGSNARWDSSKIEVAPGFYTVSAWMAQNLAYTQDPGYGGVLAAVLFDKQGKEVERLELAKAYKPPRRDSYDMYAIPEKGGLAWDYYECTIEVLKNAAVMQLVFTWSDFTCDWRKVETFIVGEVYLDDILITPGKQAKTEEIDVFKKVKKFPYQLRINTPVSGNVFLKDDPLEFTVRLDGENGPPQMAGMKFRYRIEDYQRLLIDQGEFGLSQPYMYWRKAPDAKKESLLKTFYLGENVRRETGKWMAIRVWLEHSGKVLAEGENAFTITNPRVLTVEEMVKSHFFDCHPAGEVGRIKIPIDPEAPWGPSRRFNIHEKQGTFGMANHGGGNYWKRHQPTKDSPISFAGDSPSKDYRRSKASQQTFEFHERIPNRTHMLQYTQVLDCIPDWAWAPGKYKPGHKFGSVESDFIQPEAYAKYVEEYVRHTSATYYYITSPEGGNIDQHPNLVRAAYAAVKRVDPRLKVVAQVEYYLPVEYAKKLCDSGLIDFVDVLVFDIYTGRMGEACRKFRNYLESRGKHKEYWIAEYCYTGSKDQEERTRRMADYCVWTLANGVDKISWYGNHFITPTIRSPLPPGGIVYGQMGMLEGQEEKLSAGMTTLPRLSYEWIYAKGNFFPYLQWVMLYQLNQHFAIEDFRAKLTWGKDIEGVLFDGNRYSTAAVWRPANIPAQIMTLDTGDVPYIVTDMYGRTKRIVPVNGKSILTIGQNPLLFKFDRKVNDFKAQPSSLQITQSQSAIAPGTSGDIQVSIRNEFGKPCKANLTIIVNDSWKVEPAVQAVTLTPNETAEISFKLTAPKDVEPGDYPLLVSVDTSSGAVIWLHEKVSIGSPIEMTLSERPYTKTQPPAVLVTIKNGMEKEISGTVFVRADFGKDMRPTHPQAKVSVPANGEKTMEFALNGWIPDMARDYPTTAELILSDGKAHEAKRVLSFRGIEKRRKPIKIDGSLEDWDMNALVPFDFFRVHSTWPRTAYNKMRAERWSGIEDSSGRFYTQWDEENLYFAFIIQDDKYLPGEKGVNIWDRDALLFLLYPFGVQPDSIIRGKAYREHIGLDEDNMPTYDRCDGTVGDWTIGSGQPEGVQVAVKPTKKGVVMEFAVPFRQFAPLEAKKGSRFALTLLHCDRDGKENKDGAAWYYTPSNVEVNPALFGNFILTE